MDINDDCLRKWVVKWQLVPADIMVFYTKLRVVTWPLLTMIEHYKPSQTQGVLSLLLTSIIQQLEHVYFWKMVK